MPLIDRIALLWASAIKFWSGFETNLQLFSKSTFENNDYPLAILAWPRTVFKTHLVKYWTAMLLTCVVVQQNSVTVPSTSELLVHQLSEAGA